MFFQKEYRASYTLRKRITHILVMNLSYFKNPLIKKIKGSLFHELKFIAY